MFGFVNINTPELKIKDFDAYRSYYCGLCRSLGRRHGLFCRVTLSYDMTFLGLLLSALYEPDTLLKKRFCLLHPGAKHPVSQNSFIDYAADMNLLLSYYDLLDDWKDEKKLLSKAEAGLIRSAVKSIEAQYPRQAEAVHAYMKALSACEQENSADLDLASGLTGRMLGEIFAMQEDVWMPHLQKLGFYLGKFIYLMDAFEDLEKDRQKSNYNPWLFRAESRAAVSAEAKEVLTMMMNECTLAFEHLPILLHGDILRNILYAGVWNRFEKVMKEEREKAEKAQGKGEK